MTDSIYINFKLIRCLLVAANEFRWVKMRIRRLKGAAGTVLACIGSRRFARDESGAIAIMFGLLALALAVVVGGTIDYARWQSAQTKTISAMDTAVLAATRALQLRNSTESQALSIAQSYYDRHKPANLEMDNAVFSVEANGARVQGTVNNSIKAYFLPLVGRSSLFVNHVSKAEMLPQTSVEVAMILDVSGSMDTGTKLADLKMAAKDFIDIVLWEDQSQYTSRVALVPFASYVNAGSYAQTVTGVSSASTACVKERVDESTRYTDAAPISGQYFGYHGDGTGNDFLPCTPVSPIVPLSDNKLTLETAIDAMVADGGTAGHMALAWGWNTISPNWNSVWPLASRPITYNEMTTIQVNGKPNLRKFAVLMTDGEFNTQAHGADSNTQADALCSAMKAIGIEIYTIAFDIAAGSTAESVVQNCATSSMHFYNASDGDALKSAFRNISIQISPLRITN